MTKEIGKANGSIASMYGKPLDIQALTCSSGELTPLNFTVHPDSLLCFYYDFLKYKHEQYYSTSNYLVSTSQLVVIVSWLFAQIINEKFNFKNTTFKRHMVGHTDLEA